MEPDIYLMLTKNQSGLAFAAQPPARKKNKTIESPNSPSPSTTQKKRQKKGRMQPANDTRRPTFLKRTRRACRRAAAAVFCCFRPPKEKDEENEGREVYRSGSVGIESRFDASSIGSANEQVGDLGKVGTTDIKVAASSGKDSTAKTNTEERLETAKHVASVLDDETAVTSAYLPEMSEEAASIVRVTDVMDTVIALATEIIAFMEAAKRRAAEAAEMQSDNSTLDIAIHGGIPNVTAIHQASTVIEGLYQLVMSAAAGIYILTSDIISGVQNENTALEIAVQGGVPNVTAIHRASSVLAGVCQLVVPPASNIYGPTYGPAAIAGSSKQQDVLIIPTSSGIPRDIAALLSSLISRDVPSPTLSSSSNPDPTQDNLASLTRLNLLSNSYSGRKRHASSLKRKFKIMKWINEVNEYF